MARFTIQAPRRRSLLIKPLTSLNQIEQIVASAKRFDAEGKLENDRCRNQLALQGDTLLQRVAQARKLYEELKRGAESKRGVRGLTAHLSRSALTSQLIFQPEMNAD